MAIDADTKLVCSFTIGPRDSGTAYEFMQDVAQRLRCRVQLTTDGFRPYLMAVEDAFGADIDYAQLIKIYGETDAAEKRYSPAKCIGCDVKIVAGDPEPQTHQHVGISSARTSPCGCPIRRFTRLTNAFSQEDRESHRLNRHPLHALQLLPDSSNAPRHTSDGSWRH